MILKVISVFIIFGILFSYIPMIPMDDCSEGNQMGNIKMECGYFFHCPITVNIIPETSNLPLNGRLDLAPTLLNDDELTQLIFHPPKYWA